MAALLHLAAMVATLFLSFLYVQTQHDLIFRGSLPASIRWKEEMNEAKTRAVFALSISNERFSGGFPVY